VIVRITISNCQRIKNEYKPLFGGTKLGKV